MDIRGTWFCEGPTTTLGSVMRWSDFCIHVRGHRRGLAAGYHAAGRRKRLHHMDSTILLLTKSEVFSHFPGLYSPVRVGPGPRLRQVSSRRGS